MKSIFNLFTVSASGAELPRLVVMFKDQPGWDNRLADFKNEYSGIVLHKLQQQIDGDNRF